MFVFVNDLEFLFSLKKSLSVKNMYHRSKVFSVLISFVFARWCGNAETVNLEYHFNNFYQIVLLVSLLFQL